MGDHGGEFVVGEGFVFGKVGVEVSVLDEVEKQDLPARVVDISADGDDRGMGADSPVKDAFCRAVNALVHHFEG